MSELTLESRKEKGILDLVESKNFWKKKESSNLMVDNNIPYLLLQRLKSP